MLSFRSLAAACVMLAATAGPATAQTAPPISGKIAADGLEATRDYLVRLADPTPSDRFALGGITFLRAIEESLQARYRANLGAQSELPMLRLPIPPNPDPVPFEPDMIASIFTDAITRFAEAEAALAAIDGEVALPLDLHAIWFDIDESGTRDTGEDLFGAIGSILGEAPPENLTFTVNFDTADVAWLRAYAHLLSGISEVILAYDPTEAIGTVTKATAELRPNTVIGSQQEIDQLAITLLALRQEPDAERTRRALVHFEAMIAHNRTFWAAVAAETDDNAEWIPNAAQSSAFGPTISVAVAAAWQAVLDEGESVLKGETVLPYWRLKRGGRIEMSGNATGETEMTITGINVRKLFTDPTPVDLILWIQGAGALPYLDEGRMANNRNWRQFMRLVGGDAPLYALWFN